MADLHEEAIVFDGLIVANWSRAVFEDMRRGGVTAANCTCSIWEGFQPTIDNIAQWKRWFVDHDDVLLQVRTTADIARAKRAGKTGIVLGFQNTSAFEDQLGYVQIFKELGVGIVQMTYNTQNFRRRVLRDHGSWSLGFRPRGRGRDEPGRHPMRSLARRPPDLRRHDPHLGPAGLLLSLPAVGAKGASPQQIRCIAQVHRRPRRLHRRHHVSGLPPRRHRGHGG